MKHSEDVLAVIPRMQNYYKSYKNIFLSNFLVENVFLFSDIYIVQL